MGVSHLWQDGHNPHIQSEPVVEEQKEEVRENEKDVIEKTRAKEEDATETKEEVSEKKDEKRRSLVTRKNKKYLKLVAHNFVAWFYWFLPLCLPL